MPLLLLIIYLYPHTHKTAIFSSMTLHFVFILYCAVTHSVQVVIFVVIVASQLLCLKAGQCCVMLPFQGLSVKDLQIEFVLGLFLHS